MKLHDTRFNHTRKEVSKISCTFKESAHILLQKKVGLWFSAFGLSLAEDRGVRTVWINLASGCRC